MKRHTYTKLTALILAFILLFCSCSSQAGIPPEESAPSETSAPLEETSPPKENPAQEALNSLEVWFDKQCSFSISCSYMNIAINNMSQETVQTFAKDGSWVMTNHRHVVNHATSYEFEEDAEFYYRYENSQLVCYRRIGDEAPVRSIMTEADLSALAASREIMLGVPGLLPEYLQDLSVAEEDGTAIVTFCLPAEKVLDDNTFLAVYLNNVFNMANTQYDKRSNATILCTIKADPETFQPSTLSFDFSELKPYVLASGSLSGEYALGVDLMVMTYAFDYDFPDTTQIPEYMIL